MDLIDRIDRVEARFDALEPSIQAFLPEHGRFDRLRREARSLCDRYPDPHARPPLFGVLAGVKDIFHVDGFATGAGSRLPPSTMRGAEADSVSRLRHAGALIVGKTVTTEFAHSAPGPTRNPHNTQHTPGGSSSGSAAAVAAGFCDLGLGTQTIGSIIRPAAFCGVVGLKPTFGRVSTGGVIPLAPSLDHVGCLAIDVPTVSRAAQVLCADWYEPSTPRRAPVLGIPEGPYLDRVAGDTMAWFRRVCETLAAAGYELRPAAVMADYAAICERHHVILAAEAARTHAAWFDEYAPLYGEQISDLIRRGRLITERQLRSALDGQGAFRRELSRRMIELRIDAWICPSTIGPAPEGLATTGDPIMNLPWTHAGLPAINLPAGLHRTGLPMGVQIVGTWHGDESLLVHAEALHRVTSQL